MDATLLMPLSCRQMHCSGHCRDQPARCPCSNRSSGPIWAKKCCFFSHPKELQPFAGENSASPTPCLTTSTQSHEYHGGSTTSDTHLEHKLFHVLGANLTHGPPRDKYIPTTHMPFPVFLCAFFKMLILQTKQSRC